MLDPLSPSTLSGVVSSTKDTVNSNFPKCTVLWEVLAAINVSIAAKAAPATTSRKREVIFAVVLTLQSRVSSRTTFLNSGAVSIGNGFFSSDLSNYT